MEVNEKRIWGIHTKDDNLFLKKSVIAIGWIEMGDLSELGDDREAFKKKYSKVFPDASKMSVANCVGSLMRFAVEMSIGDYVVFPSKSNREINIGIIESDYYFDNNELHYKQMRKVKWLKHIPRSSFTQGALYEIGAFTTVFLIKNYAEEFFMALNKGFKNKEFVDETVARTANEIKEATKDFIIKELSRKYKGFAFEEFVADLLGAMGYRTKISPQGGDSGIDIVAYKDELPPRIVVQVKSQDSDIKESTIQSLRGAMKEGDYGLFVTLSNYTKNANDYLEHTPIIRAINGTQLVDLILVYYDKLSEKHRNMIPLEMVYVPVIKEEN